MCGSAIADTTIESRMRRRSMCTPWRDSFGASKAALCMMMSPSYDSMMHLNAPHQPSHGIAQPCSRPPTCTSRILASRSSPVVSVSTPIESRASRLLSHSRSASTSSRLSMRCSFTSASDTVPVPVHECEYVTDLVPVVSVVDVLTTDEQQVHTHASLFGRQLRATFYECGYELTRVIGPRRSKAILIFTTLCCVYFTYLR